MNTHTIDRDAAPDLDDTTDLDEAETRATDDELMACLVAGDAEHGLSILRQRYERMVHRLAMKIVRDRDAADDVTQEAFTKVFFKSHQYLPGTSFRAWLLGVTRNHALSYLRGQRHRSKAIGSITSDAKFNELDVHFLLEPGQEDRSLETREFMAAFERAVDALPERYRMVFRACVILGRSYREVAEEWDVPVGTIAIRIMRARKRLYRQLSCHLDRVRRPPACVQ